MEHILVFGLKIPIKKTKDLIKQGITAYYDSESKEIIFDEALLKEECISNLQSTIIHEAGHALFDRLAWNQSIPIELEQAIVECYATFILENFEVLPKCTAKKNTGSSK